jgi:hypothetical protein
MRGRRLVVVIVGIILVLIVGAVVGIVSKAIRLPGGISVLGMGELPTVTASPTTPLPTKTPRPTVTPRPTYTLWPTLELPTLNPGPFATSTALAKSWVATLTARPTTTAIKPFTPWPTATLWNSALNRPRTNDMQVVICDDGVIQMVYKGKGACLKNGGIKYILK